MYAEFLDSEAFGIQAGFEFEIALRKTVLRSSNLKKVNMCVRKSQSFTTGSSFLGVNRVWPRRHGVFRECS
jgi:hypothetical protein